MTMIEPYIKCYDYWCVPILELCLKAYKVMIEKGQIHGQRVIYNQEYGSSIVEYESTIPHEWILEELKKLTIELADQSSNEQLTMQLTS